jgi:hypothetical protein
MIASILQDLRAGALIHAFLHELADALGIQTIAPPDAGAGRLADDCRLMKNGQGRHPGRVLQSHEPAASRFAVGQCGHLRDEFGSCVSHSEGHSERIGYPGRAEENARIAEIRATLRETLP